MRLILHSAITAETIRQNLGKPEYSYYFVLETYRPVLERLGDVTIVAAPDQVDPIFTECAARGEDCVFICFAPPNLVPLDLQCPTVVVFAWEFDTIPDGAWAGAGPQDDWRVVFRRLGAAITLSNFTADVVRAAMGEAFAVFAVAAPVFDRWSAPLPDRPKRISAGGTVVDSRDYALSAAMGAEPFTIPAPLHAPEPIPEPVPVPMPIVVQAPEPEPTPARRPGLRARLAITRWHLLQWYREALRDLLPQVATRGISQTGRLFYRLLRPAALTPLPAAPPLPPAVPAVPPPPAPPPVLTEVALDGVVYTSLFNPADGRKNWHDLLTAFCWAFRDTPDATLVMKMVKDPARDYRREMFLLLTRLSPFKCRVVMIDGFLEDAEYRKLIAATDYYVNVSNAEGLCLPLMEFMAASVPAIAPRHTAMLDYIDETAAFIVRATPEHNVWPNDPRHAYTTMRQRPQWDTIVAGFNESYRTATQAPGRQAEMGRNAARIMRDYCGDDVIAARLAAALRAVLDRNRPAVNLVPEPSKDPVAHELLQPAAP